MNSLLLKPSKTGEGRSQTLLDDSAKQLSAGGGEGGNRNMSTTTFYINGHI